MQLTGCTLKLHTVIGGAEKLRYVKIEDLEPDMILAKTITGDDGNTLLKQGCKNLQKYSRRLAQLGINHVYIEDKVSEDIEVKTVITKQERMESKKAVKEVLEDIKQGKKLNIQNVSGHVDNIIEDITNNKELIINLKNIRSKDAYTFSHSVNATVLAIKIGIGLNISKDKLKKLGKGVMLHDIGKVKIPDSILKKKGKLTDEEYKEIKSHPDIGYKLVKNNFDITSLSQYILKHHHEKIDGSGYPHGKTGDELHQFAKIACVCDVFDALTSDRCYRDAWSNAKALDMLISKAGIEFDAQVVSAFKQNIAMYPNGTKVTLSNGKKALIKEQNPGMPERPIVKVIEDELGNKLKKPKKINLLNILDLTIIS